ncbi:MAG: Helix-turn-helix domain protein [Syntrophorhabdus sp. PtaB.Bin006]|nr:MAG: Helix-turn-helix domain protein [Syntrophorhabdus sp. PtaB.Bin006]
MRIELEPQDLQAIADRVIEVLRPHLQVGSNQEDTIFDKAGLAEYLHVDVSWINKQITARAIPYLKMGKYTRFRKTDIDRWLEGMKVDLTPYVKLLKRG